MTDEDDLRHPALDRDIFVPVAVDAAREVEGIEMLRATYFAVTTDSPTSVWEIELPPIAPLQGIGALGMLGVAFSAVRRAQEELNRNNFDLFLDPEDVSAIFALEAERGLSIQLEDIWLPLSWCVGAPTWGTEHGPTRHSPIARGDVYRIRASLFRQAYRYAAADITVEQLIEEDPVRGVFRSPGEAEALRSWAENQINEAKRVFHEAKPPLQLEYA